MKLRNVLAPIVMLFALANCSIDVDIDDITPDDFLKSTILATSRGVGDGQTQASIVILLKNSNGSVVTNYQPTFNFIDNGGSSIGESGITHSECSLSNENGITTCTVRSVVVGIRRVLFNNIAIDLVGEIFFDPPDRDGTFTQILNASQIDQNAGGYSVTSQIGAPFAGLKQEVDGYVIFTNTTGGITPDE